MCPLESSALPRPHPASRQPTVRYCAETKFCVEKKIQSVIETEDSSPIIHPGASQTPEITLITALLLGPGPRPRAAGARHSAPWHDLQNGPSRPGGLVPPSCPPAQPHLTACPHGGQVRAQCLPSKCWGALGGSTRIPAHLGLSGGRRRENPQQPL